MSSKLWPLVRDVGLFKAFKRLAVSEVSKNQKLPRGFCRTPPFGIFVKENFKTNESGDPQKFMIEMKNRWNSLDDSTKKIYFDRSLADFESKKAKFESLSDEEKEKIMKEGLRRKERKQKMKEKKASKRIGQMHKPPSAYNLFVKENSSMFRKAQTVEPKMVMKNIASSWNSLSEQEKKKYVDRAKNLAEEYKSAVKS
ncbi:unnamed protein product [Dracunculus medinensis]|uniref:HMG box domain-containing protein n=1 Tax=Dracunculus medinensis TaxID=318479 RepID=A0A158Q4M2_DRAME|nr:unnamed protein product [Dracunculus medinensis]